MEHTNTITLIGCPYGRAEYSHSNHGRHFFSFYLQVERLSGAVDTLPILIPESLLASTELTEADALRITGQIRSYNNRSAVGRRLIISVLADSLELCNEAHENEVHLQGVICKEPCYRKTPLGREICDIMLAVNRPYHKADYLPCILWGRTAQEIAACHTRDCIRICGRLQSRIYTKLTETGAEERTAYEISALTADILQQEI